MKALLYGATGMIGQGILRELLNDPAVTDVFVVARRTIDQQSAKLREITARDPGDPASITAEMAACDACFFAIGVTSAGMNERDYRKVTLQMPLAVANRLVTSNPNMTFIYVSGASADSTGTSTTMWARVKGEAENALAALPFKGSYSVRPAAVRPMHGIRSRTPMYNALYLAFGWALFPIMARLFPKKVTTTERLGRGMIELAKNGSLLKLLENHEIDALADRSKSF